MGCTLFSDYCVESKSKRASQPWFCRSAWPGSNGVCSHFYINGSSLSQNLPYPVMHVHGTFPWGEGIGSLKQRVESSLNWRAELQGQAHRLSWGYLSRGTDPWVFWLSWICPKQCLIISSSFLLFHSPPQTTDTLQLLTDHLARCLWQ